MIVYSEFRFRDAVTRNEWTVYSFSEPISFVDTPNVQSVKEGEDAFIKCMTTGDPEPSISWYYNGEPLNCKLPIYDFF